MFFLRFLKTAAFEIELEHFIRQDVTIISFHLNLFDYNFQPNFVNLHICRTSEKHFDPSGHDISGIGNRVYKHDK